MKSDVLFPGLEIVVFGSAAAYALDRSRTPPRDIDAVWSWVGIPAEFVGNCLAMVESVVRRWARKQGLEGLPLDIHRQCHGEPIELPAPWGIPGEHVVLLAGEQEPAWRGYYGLAATIRAFGRDADKLREVLLEGQPGSGLGPGRWEIQADPKSRWPEQWDEHYCDGLAAMRSAMKHAAPGVWAAATADIPWARFVNALLDRGPSYGGLRELMSASSGGAARCFVGCSVPAHETVDMETEEPGVGTQYGKPLSIDDAIVRYVAPVPLLLNTSIVTGLPSDDGAASYEIRRIDRETAKAVVRGGFTSAIGHAASAAALSTILGVPVPENRIAAAQEIGQRAIVLKLCGRLPEGAILSPGEMERIGFDLFLMTRTA